jgi:hypothetical protein
LSKGKRGKIQIAPQICGGICGGVGP